MAFLGRSDLRPTRQSSLISTLPLDGNGDTAVLRVLTDILCGVDRDNFAALVLPGLSAAVDTVDHGNLLERLRSHLGLQTARILGCVPTLRS